MEVQVSVSGSGSKVRLSMLGRADKTMRYQEMLVCADRVHELLKAVKDRVPPVPSKYVYKLVNVGLHFEIYCVHDMYTSSVYVHTSLTVSR